MTFRANGAHQAFNTNVFSRCRFITQASSLGAFDDFARPAMQRTTALERYDQMLKLCLDWGKRGAL